MLIRALAILLVLGICSGSSFARPNLSLPGADDKKESLFVEAEDHDFHVSVMRVDYNPENQALEVTLKVFTDDIEKSLEGLGAPTLRLGSPRELPESDSIFSDYLNNRLSFFVDDQHKTFDYLGKEVELDNTTWCYIEVKGVKDFQSLRIRNKVLMELFDDQTNLVNIFVLGKKKSLLLRGGQPEDETTF